MVAACGLVLGGCVDTTVETSAPPTSSIESIGPAPTVDLPVGPENDGNEPSAVAGEPSGEEGSLLGADPGAPPSRLAPPPAGGEEGAPIPAVALAPAGAAAEPARPVAVEGGTVAISPENTKIQFVGTHAGDKPDPRTCGFGKFSGQAEVDAQSQKLKSLNVEIDTTSIFTEFAKLTDHLKSPDFFEVREYPTAKFESTSIEQSAEGKATITGNLTLHGVTKEITFPATVTVTDEGLTLKSEFTIDRSEFGMTFSPDKVNNDVAMTVVVGEPTQAE
jgi:polyisoprenoid-binding protein YceI